MNGHDDGRPRLALAALTRRLAELLSSDDGAVVLAQLQRIGLLGLMPKGSPVIPSLDPAGPERIGIWERRPEGSYARSAALADEWRFWADVDCIEPKQRRRVVLLGESTARGYLYDPALTPAEILGARLPGVEVVDLARSDITVDGLATLIDALPTLQPDAIVLFAGNNSHNVRYSLDDLGRLATELRRGGYAGCRRLVVDEIVVSQYRALLERLAVRAGRVPVVVVIPEFNLGDWRVEPPVLVPVLAGDANVTWMFTRAAAERALVAGTPEVGAELAEEMIALDGGTSGVAHELLGRALIELGRTDEARAALEAARDAVCGIFVPHTPRCPAAVQRVLRDGANTHRFDVVDLPALFVAELDGDLPDRRLFLDYCHLTARGMTVAMGAVAEVLAPQLDGIESDPDRSPALTPADKATAHFLAAVHNAHHGQPRDIVRHHLEAALRAAPSVRQQVEWYLDAHRRASDTWTSVAFERLCESPLVSRYLAATDQRVMDPLADSDLIEAIEAVLGDADPSPSLSPATWTPIDLLAPRHAARTFRERFGSTLAPTRAYYRALDLTSSFRLGWTAPGAARARITCRLPGAVAETAEAAEVEVVANGIPVARLEVGGAWQTFDIGFELRAGRNELLVEWPLLAPRADELLRQGANRLERGVYPDVLPAYGEVHSFTVTTLGASSPRR